MCQKSSGLISGVLTRSKGSVDVLVEFPFSVHKMFLTQRSTIISAMMGSIINRCIIL